MTKVDCAGQPSPSFVRPTCSTPVSNRVGRRSVLLVRAAEADMSANRNQRWPTPLVPCSPKGGGDHANIVASFNSWTCQPKATKRAIRSSVEGELRAAFDGHVVVGIEDDQFAQSQVTSIGSGLGRDPFLQVAIAH